MSSLEKTKKIGNIKEENLIKAKGTNPCTLLGLTENIKKETVKVQESDLKISTISHPLLSKKSFDDLKEAELGTEASKISHKLQK